MPESGAKPTKVGRLVLELQQKLPGARVVYCSATGDIPNLFPYSDACLTSILTYP